MEKLRKLRRLKKEIELAKERRVLMQELLFKRRQRALQAEEACWQASCEVHALQRTLIQETKKLSEDEQLAFRSGLTIEEVRQARKLLATKAETTGG